MKTAFEAQVRAKYIDFDDDEVIPPSRHDREDQEREAQEYDTLICLIHKSSPEIFNLIQYWLFEILFCPAYLFTTRDIRPKVAGWPTDSPARPGLLSLSKYVYLTYQQCVWTENVYIIDRPTFSLRRSPKKGLKYFRKVQLAFTIRDLGNEWAKFLPSKPLKRNPDIVNDTLPEPESADQPVNRPNMLELRGDLTMNDRCSCSYHASRFDLPRSPIKGATAKPCLQCSTEMLLALWFRKTSRIYRLRRLKLSELIVDLSECYGANKEWLGNIVAEQIGGALLPNSLLDKLILRVGDADLERLLIRKVRRTKEIREGIV
ncbi:MAG: hypothetical protein Q9209_002369 [Squamulea sp. 1 TL-2023]